MLARSVAGRPLKERGAQANLWRRLPAAAHRATLIWSVAPGPMLTPVNELPEFVRITTVGALPLAASAQRVDGGGERARNGERPAAAAKEVDAAAGNQRAGKREGAPGCPRG